MAAVARKREGKGGGEEQGGAAIPECAGMDTAARVHPRRARASRGTSGRIGQLRHIGASAPPERHAKSGVQRLCKHSPGAAEKGPQRLRSFFTISLCPSPFPYASISYFRYSAKRAS